MNLRLIKLVSVSAMLVASFASSATVVLEKYKGTNEFTIKIEGQIVAKDLQDFKDALQQVDDYRSVLHMNAVQLNSGGGSGMAALEIGKILRAKKLNTYLDSQDSCASACVNILIAGVMRYAFGEVAVHRSTYNREIPNTDSIAADIVEWKKQTNDYIASMGISSMLGDAIQSTPSWQIRILTPSEIRQWQVMGTDQQTEEELFTQTAKEKFISRKEFIDIYKQNHVECLNQAKAFVMTVLECTRSKKIKEITIFENWGEKFIEWLVSLDRSSIFIKSHSDRVEQIYKDIRSKNKYLRYMTVGVLTSKMIENTDKSLQLLSKDDVKEMEAKNEWWVSKNNFSVVLANPTNQKITKITFSISTTDCHHDGKKQYIVLELLEPLDRYRTVVYTGALPFDYTKEIGDGERCGIVEAVFRSMN